MIALLPVPFVALAVYFLLQAERASPRDERRVRVWKPAATVLVIAIAILSLNGRHNAVYTTLITIALTLCLVGDVYLIDGSKPGMFLRGLAAFLFAHIMLIAAFSAIQNSRHEALNLPRELAVGAVLLFIVLLLYWYMRGSLGAMRQPVLVYMVVIALMAHRALSGADVSNPRLDQSTLAALGAMFFMVSDAMLALSVFVFPKDEGEPRGSDAVAILGAYYAAIVLLALSCSFV